MNTEEFFQELTKIKGHWFLARNGSIRIAVDTDDPVAYGVCLCPIEMLAYSREASPKLWKWWCNVGEARRALKLSPQDCDNIIAAADHKNLVELTDLYRDQLLHATGLAA